MSCPNCGEQFCPECRASVEAIIAEETELFRPDYLTCPVCIAMFRLVESGSERALTFAEVELDRHPNHHPQTVSFLETHPVLVPVPAPIGEREGTP